MSSKFDTARLMYMAGNNTQRSIAKTLKVSERTVYTWIKNAGWDRLRQAARTAPAIIAGNIFSQIVELQNDIAAREEGKRYPTMQEAELTRKLVLSVDRMKSAPALSQTMQVLRMFRSFANGYGDTRFRLLLNQVIEHFVEGEAVNGYLPYQLEYGPAVTPEPELPVPETEFPDDTQSPELMQGFSPAKDRQANEKRSLFVNQGGGDSTQPASIATSEADEMQSEVGRQKSSESGSDKGFEAASGTPSHPAEVGSVSEVSPHSLPPSLTNDFNKTNSGHQASQ